MRQDDQVNEFHVAATAVRPDVGLVTATGELDMYTADQVGVSIDEARSGGASIVVVDLSAVSFIDSTALAMLVERKKRLGADGGEVIIVADGQPVLRAFEVTGLDRVFRIYREVDEALETL
jgi:anti-sigma B factor antagonist